MKPDRAVARHASDLNELLPNTEHAIFSQSSHAPFMTEHDAFCEQVREFAYR